MDTEVALLDDADVCPASEGSGTNLPGAGVVTGGNELAQDGQCAKIPSVSGILGASCRVTRQRSNPLFAPTTRQLHIT